MSILYDAFGPRYVTLPGCGTQPPFYPTYRSSSPTVSSPGTSCPTHRTSLHARPADAAQWTPPQEYQAWKTPLWYRYPSISPVLYHNGPARIFCHHTHVVAYQDYRFSSFVQHLHLGKELVQMFPVLPGCWFIQHYNIRFHRQYRSNRQPLPLAPAR